MYEIGMYEKENPCKKFLANLSKNDTLCFYGIHLKSCTSELDIPPSFLGQFRNQLSCRADLTEN